MPARVLRAGAWVVLLGVVSVAAWADPPGRPPEDELEATGAEEAVPEAAAAAPPRLERVFRYQDFSETPVLLLFDQAQTYPRPGGAAAGVVPVPEPRGLLRLTDALSGVRGATWYPEKVAVAGGFVSRFTLRFTGQDSLPGIASGADGAAFVIAATDVQRIGNAGCGMGYDGIPRSLVVEFDTFENTFFCGYGDPNDNHISVHLNRSATPGANNANESHSIKSTLTGLDVDLKDGARHQVEIAYEAGELRVFVDDMQTPKLSVRVDLAKELSLPDSKAWVGFTAATASAWEAHDVLNWTMQAVTQTCFRSRFNQVYSWPGLTVYRRGSRAEYMAVVNLNDAELKSLIDFQNPPAPGYYVTHTESTWVQRAPQVCPAGTTMRLVRNGVFGAVVSPGTSTNVAHGLKVDGGFIFYGYETPPPGQCSGQAPCPRTPDEFRVLSFDNGASTSAVSNPWDQAGFNNWVDGVGGFAPDRVVSGNTRGRGYAGVTETGEVLLYSTSDRSARRHPEHVQQCLEEFGAPRSRQVQLDGGGSTFLRVDGTRLVRSDGRALTHALVVCTP